MTTSAIPHPVAVIAVGGLLLGIVVALRPRGGARRDPGTLGVLAITALIGAAAAGVGGLALAAGRSTRTLTIATITAPMTARSTLYRITDTEHRAYGAAGTEAAGLAAGLRVRCEVRDPLPLLGGTSELRRCRPER